MDETMQLTIDLKNYVKEESVYRRTAIRGIIEKDGKYLMIYSKYGDYKFPGGGAKEGEEHYDTLIREVQEETGFHVNISSITLFGYVHEKRKGNPEDVLDMNSYYYYCNVLDDVGIRNLDPYESEYDYQIIWITLEEAIRKNEVMNHRDTCPWVERELLVMKELIARNNTPVVK